MPPNGITSYRPPVMSSNYMVSSGHYLGTMAGTRMLEDGGNAIDAGVATGIALNVTLPHLISFAGVAPILIYVADKDEVVSISGLGRWPKAAALDYYTKRYNGDIPLGVARSVVPAACDAWLTALELYGTMTLEHVMAPSIELAEKGYAVTAHMARGLAGKKEYFQTCPSTAEIFMHNGETLRVGERLVQKDLAEVFRQMVDVERANAHRGREGAIRAARDYFYKGEIAEKMVKFSEEGDGIISKEDFAEFQVKVERPEVGSYKEYGLYTCGAWCQGPTLIQMLNILEGIDLEAMGHNSSQYLHTLMEAENLAFSDRHSYYGDPDLVEVPIEGLLSKEYAAHRRAAIDPGKAWPEMPPAGDPWKYQGGTRSAPLLAAGPRSGFREPDTSYASVVDRWGNAFSATPSDSIGTMPIVPGLGMIISGRGSQIWLEPGHPSCLAPWKRPRLTPNPAMVFKNGRLFMPFGTPGGDNQVPSMVQAFLNMAEFGMIPQQAVEQPRVASASFPDSFWPHVYDPAKVLVEDRIEEGTAKELADMGHKIGWLRDWDSLVGMVCMVVVDHEKGLLHGAADPRRDGYSVGW